MENKTVYKLTNNRTPLSFLLNSGSNGALTVIKDGKKQAIRYCPNEPSIFLKEQSEFAIPGRIVFENGHVLVGEDEPNKKDFLEIYPGNTKNGGNVFYLFNPETEAQESLKREDLVSELKYKIKEKLKAKEGKYELQALTSVLTGSVTQASELTDSELRKLLHSKIDENPYRFVGDDGEINIFNEDVKLKHISLLAFAKGLIKVSKDGKKIVWAKGNQLIINIPLGTKAEDYFADHLKSEEGVLLIEEIYKKL